MNLQNLNVAELSAQEVRETEGGFGIGLLELVAGAVITICVTDWENVKAGFNGKPPVDKC